ncbi:MAG: patatin-like phospholipase family protein [Alphaproteobacteria bacterium]
MLEELAQKARSAEENGRRKKKVFAVLAIDGGGLRGIVPAKVLQELEERTGKPVSELFDMVVGTSTGGLLSLGLTTPDRANPRKPRYSARDMVELYEGIGDQIFPKPTTVQRLRGLFRDTYDPRPFERLLRQKMGNARIKESLTSVIVTAYDTARRGPVFMKHYKNHAENRHFPDFLTRDAIRATCSAPTYFPPAEISSLPQIAPDGRRFQRRYELIDGGVFMTNPAAHAMIEAMRIKPEDTEILLVSLGTGIIKTPFPADDIKKWGQVGWIRSKGQTPIYEVIMDGQTDSADMQMKALLRERYMRLDANFEDMPPNARPAFEFDDSSKENMQALANMGDYIIRNNDKAIDRLCAVLKGEKGLDSLPPDPAVPAIDRKRANELIAKASRGAVLDRDAAKKDRPRTGANDDRPPKSNRRRLAPPRL